MSGLASPPESVDVSAPVADAGPRVYFDSDDDPSDGFGGAPPRGPRGPNTGGRPPVPPVQKAVRIGVLLVFWMFAVAIALIWFGQDKVPAKTVVAGVDIGGLSHDEAVAKLNAAFAKKAGDQISLKIADNVVKVDPSAVGLSLNVPATVDQVMTSRWNPFDAPSEFFGGGKANLVVGTDPQVMNAKLADLNNKYAQVAREAEITYSGTTPVLDTPVTGNEINTDQAAQALTANYLQSDSAIELPLNISQPQVSLDQARQVVKGSATNAVSAPISVKVGEVTAQASPANIAAALSYQVKDGQLQPVVDGTKLHELLAPQLKSVDSGAKDATWDVSSGKPVLVPAVDGNGVTDDHLRDSVTEVLERTGPDRSVVMPLGPIEPKLTTDAAAKLNITEKMASFTQNFPYAAYRIQNIGQAAKKINKTLLYPGQVFSMNDTVGERTKANGFTTGYVVGEGGKLKEDLGGGVSTAATALWTAAFYAGLESVEHGSHLIWISRYQPGLEATVAWGQLDLKFKNNTPDGVYITAKMTNSSITFTMWGTKQYDKIKAVSGPKTNIVPFGKETDSGPGCVPQGGVNGFSINVDRVFYKAGQEVNRETFNTSYIPAANVTCAPAAAASKPSTPSSSPSSSSSSPSAATKPHG